jgi:molecular chaperone DnaJ
MADFYATLGVSRTASADEIKRAYRRLARELHPDTNPDPAAEAKFKEVARAYEVLGDADRRHRYDTYGEAGVANGGRGGVPFDVSGFGDIFDAFFGGGGATRGGRPTGPARGPDLEAVAQISFVDAMFGCQTEVPVRTAVACETCEATGATPGTSASVCNECGGTGQVRRMRQSILGQVVTAGPCGVCGGQGQVIAQPCTDCKGDGRKIIEKRYNVDVPAGVNTGSTLRLSGRGAVGSRGGGAGDLYVHLEVLPHDRFERAGNDLIHELHLSVAQAALGAHLRFETLDGDEDLVIPRGTQPGRVFRLRGRGVPHVEGRGRGDLLVQIAVDVPTDLNADQEELLRRFAVARGDEVAPAEEGFLAKIRSAFK